MTNPATTLLTLYSELRDRLNANHGALTALVSFDTQEGIRPLTTAARSLIRIDEVLTELEADNKNVALFRRQYPSWWGPIAAFPHGWGTNVSGDAAFGQQILDQIEGFRNYLEGKVFLLDDARVKTLRQVLADARDALEVDQELSNPLRVFISRLLHQIQIALDDDAIGSSFDFGAAVQGLFAAFRAAGGEKTTKHTLWENLVTNILPTAALGALIEGGSVATQLALTPGIGQ